MLQVRFLGQVGTRKNRLTVGWTTTALDVHLAWFVNVRIGGVRSLFNLGGRRFPVSFCRGRKRFETSHHGLYRLLKPFGSVPYDVEAVSDRRVSAFLESVGDLGANRVQVDVCHSRNQRVLVEDCT